MKRLVFWAITASLLVAAVVYAESALQTPTYEASALMVVGPKEPSDGKIHPIPNAPPPEEQAAQTMAPAIDSRPVAEGAIQRLGRLGGFAVAGRTTGQPDRRAGR